jgi:hypothetical protein
VLLLAHIEPDPNVHLLRRGQPSRPPSLDSKSTPGRPSMVRLPSSTLRISDRAACPHQTFTHRPCRWQHPPGHPYCRGQ